MQSGKVANHPFAIMLFPVKRRLPMLGVHFFPTGGMPPTKIFVAARVDEFEILADTHRRTIEREIFQPHFVRRLLVVPGELVVRTLDFGLWTLDGCSVAQLKQSTFNLNHTSHSREGLRRRFDWRIELIAEQMLDVVHQQLLMLHLVLETEANDSQNFLSVVAIGKLLDELRHLLIDVRPIPSGFRNCRPRARAALWTFNSRSEAFVVRVKEKQEIF